MINKLVVTILGFLPCYKPVVYYFVIYFFNFYSQLEESQPLSPKLKMFVYLIKLQPSNWILEVTSH